MKKRIPQTPEVLAEMRKGCRYTQIIVPFFLHTQNTANAQLRGEQRYHPHLKHCAINTKFEVEAKVPSVVNPS
ncbi:hypothetical protein FWP47_24045 [Vibrio parahaemolyticus]|nr:hypothetical protein [Vibrio parahaemolyticus]